MTPEYIAKLAAMSLRPTLPDLQAREHQPIECLLCHSVFTATPKSKIQHNTKNGTIGCPKCSNKTQHRTVRIRSIDALSSKFVFLDSEEYLLSSNNRAKIRVRNRDCDHVFESHFNRLLISGTNCPICNAEVKRNNFRKHHYSRVEKSRVYKDEFTVYKAKAYALTQQNYKLHKSVINPKNLPRVLAQIGIDGYHLDHKVSIRHCFFNAVPEEICAHPTNLRMLPWSENISKHAAFRADDEIPELLKPYFRNGMAVTYRGKRKDKADDT